MHWSAVVLEQKGTILKLFPQSWDHEIAKNLLVPFTGTKGPSPDPEKQPHTIIPPKVWRSVAIDSAES